jgi:hypothetical protein
MDQESILKKVRKGLLLSTAKEKLQMNVFRKERIVQTLR